MGKGDCGAPVLVVLFLVSLVLFGFRVRSWVLLLPDV